jgi:hypothetical protein
MNLILIESVNKHENLEKISEDEITHIAIIIDFLHFFIKNYGEVTLNYSKEFIEIFRKFEDSDNILLRTKISNCLLDLLKQKKELIFEDHEYFFCFFFDNYRFENYYMNLSASEFFLFLIENYEDEFKPIKEENTKELEIANGKDIVTIQNTEKQINSETFLSTYFEENLKQ